jgi:hypothetical protein
MLQAMPPQPLLNVRHPILQIGARVRRRKVAAPPQECQHKIFNTCFNWQYSIRDKAIKCCKCRRIDAVVDGCNVRRSQGTTPLLHFRQPGRRYASGVNAVLEQPIR